MFGKAELETLTLEASEFKERKALVELGDEDVENLRQIRDVAERYQDRNIEEAFRHLLSFEEGRKSFPDQPTLERVKADQRRHFMQLTEAPSDRDVVREQLRLGGGLELPLKAYFEIHWFHAKNLAAAIVEKYRQEPEKAFKTFFSLLKMLMFDLSLGSETMMTFRERTIALQQEAIRELITPVLQIRESLLLLPLVGIIDSARALLITEQLLRSIRAARAKVVVIDITGVPLVDSRVANHLLQTISAARLMGTSTIITGLSAEIAQTMVTLGLDLTKMRTAGDLQSGIEEAEKMLGYHVTKTEPKPFFER